MKTKLLAIMMMWLATIGSISGITLADDAWWTTAWFWKANGVAWVWVSWTANAATEGASSSSLLDTITNAVNWILGMLALIALIICLWGGFQMVTAAGDDGKYKKGMGILKQAAIGLVIIGVSWLFVSLIFWMIWTLSAGGSATEVTIDNGAGGTTKSTKS